MLLDNIGYIGCKASWLPATEKAYSFAVLHHEIPVSDLNWPNEAIFNFTGQCYIQGAVYNAWWSCYNHVLPVVSDLAQFNYHQPSWLNFYS